MRELRLFFLLILSGLILIACGGDSVQPLRSNPPAQEPTSQNAPLVKIAFDGFDPETTTLRFSEGQTVEFELDTLGSTITNASLSQTSGPRVNFGEMEVRGVTSDGDIMEGDGMDDIRFELQDVEGRRVAVFRRISRLRVDFVMPSVETRTPMTFLFRSNDASQSRTRIISIIIEDDASAITLTGQASKGLVSNTRVRLFSVDGFIPDLLGQRQIVEPVQIDDAGIYRFTLLPSIDFEDLLLYKIEADEADMVCDALNGCRVAEFGETFTVKKDLDLRAYIRVPQFGTIQTVNINILTTLAARSAQDLSGPLSRVNPNDVAQGRLEVARVFGLPEQNFTQARFVDVTRPIVGTSENEARIAMIGGGVLGAAFAQSDPDDNEDYLEELEDFIDAFKKGRAPCMDDPSQTTISIEDIMVSALELSRINGSAETQNFFLLRVLGIRNGSVRCEFLPRPGE